MKKHDDPGSGETSDTRARRRAVLAREEAVDAREERVGVRESATATREQSLSEREEFALYREEALRAREEAREAAAARDAVLAQMREANENLVLATLRAQELAEIAETAQREIALSEERFRSLVTTSAAVVWRADWDGRVEVERESWERFTGLRPGARAEGAWDWLGAVHVDDRERVREAWSAAVAAKGRYAQDHRLVRRDGSYGWVASRAVPIPTTGPLREWIGTMTDITDRVRVEEARDQFIGILGHDLRTPLGAIAMAARVLERSGLPQRSTDLAVRISRSARRIEAMIGALLMFASARLGSGIPLHRGPADLGRICADEVEETRHAYPKRQISCTTAGDLHGEWDTDRLEQLLTNLISNAVAHGADPIRVLASGGADDVTLSVANGGAPIPAEVASTLFEPFRARARSEGLGLGLYIVSEIVRAHGGSVSVRSEVGEGTTFTIRLPRRAPSPRTTGD